MHGTARGPTLLQPLQALILELMFLGMLIVFLDFAEGFERAFYAALCFVGGYAAFRANTDE